MALNINQGQYVLYTSTSTATAPAYYQWSFPGGTPSTFAATGSTGTTASVRYLSIGDKNVTLTITDGTGITRSKTVTNIVTVDPEVFTTSFTISGGTSSGSPLKMNTATTFTSTGTSAASYSWIIPGLGATTGSSKSYTPTDWFTVTGTYLGNPGSVTAKDVSLTTTSSIGNINSSISPWYLQKCGPSESWTTDGSTYADYSIRYKGPNYARTGNVGLGGSGLILRLDLANASFSQTKFHSDQETLSIYFNTMDISLTRPSIAEGSIIINPSSYSFLGVTYPTSARFTQGNYMISGDISSSLSNAVIYADRDQTFANLIAQRYWYDSTITSYMNAMGATGAIRLFGSSRYAEIYSPTSAESVYNSALWMSDLPVPNYVYAPCEVCVPSKLMVNYMNGGAVDDFFKIYISFYGIDQLGLVLDDGVTTYSEIEITFSGVGTTGNDYGIGGSGYFFTAQDTTTGSGISTIINNAISSYNLTDSGSIPLSDFVRFGASRDFTPFEENNFGGIVDGISYNGISYWLPEFSGDPNPIYYISIRDNTSYLEIAQYPFCVNGGQGSAPDPYGPLPTWNEELTKSWSLLPSVISADPNTTQRKFNLGGSIYS